MTDPGSPLFDFIRIMAILGGILLLAWTGLKYWLPKMTNVRATRTDVIEVVARQTLDPRNTLYVIRAGEDHLLVSASDSGVTMLRQVEIPAAVEQVTPRFADKLRRLQQQGKPS